MPNATRVAVMSGPESATHRTADLDQGLLDHTLGCWLRTAQQVVLADFMERVGKLGLSPSLFTLLVLVDRNPGCQQSDIRRAMRITHSNLVSRVEAMVAKGFIARTIVEHDRRASHLRLTAAGRTLLAEAQALHADHEAELMRRLGPSAHEALIDYLKLLSDAASQ